MLRRLFRQRRRLAVTFLLALAAVAAYPDPPLPLAFLVAIPFVAVAIGVALIVAVPNLRFLSESLVFTALLSVIVIRSTGASGETALYLLIVGTFAGAPLALAATLALLRIRWPRPFEAQGAALVTLPPAEAMSRFLDLERPWNPLVARGVRDPADPDLIRWIYDEDGPLAGTVFCERTIERGASHYIAESWTEQGDEVAAPMETLFRLDFRHHRRGTRIELTEKVSATPAHTIVYGWLDDFVADYLDQFVNVVENRPDTSIRAAMARAASGAMT